MPEDDRASWAARSGARRSASLRVHAVGAYGMSNFGDDLFTATVVENQAGIWPEAVVRTFVPTNSALYAKPSFIGMTLRTLCAAFGFLWADTIAMCGGSILQDVRGIDRLRQHGLALRKCEALGVSVGPFRDGAAATRVLSYLKLVDRLVVRDRMSAARVRDIWPEAPRVDVGGDLVALSSVVKRSDSRADSITICPSVAAGSDVDLLSMRISDAVRFVADRRGSVPDLRLLALANTRTSDDRPLCDEVARRLRNDGWTVRIESYGALGINGTVSVLTSSSMVWSQRLHGAIVAYLADVPFILDGHHAKCVDFASDIGMDNGALLSDDMDWSAAVAVALDKKLAPSVDPATYRERARRVYLSGD